VIADSCPASRGVGSSERMAKISKVFIFRPSEKTLGRGELEQNLRRGAFPEALVGGGIAGRRTTTERQRRNQERFRQGKMEPESSQLAPRKKKEYKKVGA